MEEGTPAHVYVLEVLSRPDVPLVVRDEGLDGQICTKNYLSLPRGNGLRNQNSINFACNHLCKNSFKLPNNLKRILLKIMLWEEKKMIGKEEKHNTTVLVSSKQ